MKKILIINGHPNRQSFNFALMEALKKGITESKKEVEIKELILTDLPLEKYIRLNNNEEDKDEIKKWQDLISWSDHLVFFHPVWWASMPALMKTFIDSVFITGFAFNYKKGSPFQEKLLKGKSAQIISTVDTPILIYKYFFKAPSINQLKSRILEFCGISPVSVKLIGPIHNVGKEVLEKYLKTVFEIGKSIK